MTRRHRLLLTAIALASAIGFVLLLGSLSTESEGPLVAGFDRLGAAVASIEHRLRSRVQGGGRISRLDWFAPYRDHPERLRKPDVVLLGAYDSGIPRTLDGVIGLERRIGTTFPLMQIYSAWGDKADEQFPLAVITAISNMGSVPVITWEPWLTDFENSRHPGLPLRDSREKHGMAQVAAGLYDFYVDDWAASAAKFGKPIYLRFAHEMNDPYRYPWGPQNNTKEEYIAGWRHVVQRFRAASATNVIWVWSPHVAYKYWDLYYPGASYVDWVATGALNFGPIAQWSQWWTFHEIFGTRYQLMTSFNKPIMVAEFGSLAVGGDRSTWYAAALTDLPQKYPAVKGLLFFNVADDQTVTYQKVDWRMTTDSAVTATVARAIGSWAPGAKSRRAANDTVPVR